MADLSNTRIVIELSPTEDGMRRVDLRWHDLFSYHLLEARDYRYLTPEDARVAIDENLGAWEDAQRPSEALDERPL